MTDQEASDDAEGDERTADGPRYKVLGELAHSSGAGVVGRNTAATGTPVGVEGAVPNAEGGYGLSTSDDLQVGGTARLSAIAGALTEGQSVTDLVGDGLTVDAGALAATPARPDVGDGDTAVSDVDTVSFGSGLTVRDDGEGGVSVALDTRWRMGPMLTSDDGASDDDFGARVDVSADEGTLLATAPRDDNGNGTDAGAVYLYVDPDRYRQTRKLVAPDGDGDDRFGADAALSADGSELVVGAPRDEDPSGSGGGSAYGFDNGGNWYTITNEQSSLTPSDGDADDHFGAAVGMSGDGSRAVVGAPSKETPSGTTGAAYVFDEPGGLTRWWDDATETTKLYPDDAAVGDEFGRSVDVDGDGTTVVGGARGSVSVFDGTGGWSGTTSQVATLVPGDGAATEYGRSVAVDGDGTTVVVGGAERALVFDGTDGWSGTTTAVTELTASDGGSDDYFGFAVAISEDGTRVLVGAFDYQRSNQDGAGAVYLYDGTGGWDGVTTETEQLLTADYDGSDNFGWDVAASGAGGTLVGGAVGDATNGTDTGTAYPAYETL